MTFRHLRFFFEPGPLESHHTNTLLLACRVVFSRALFRANRDNMHGNRPEDEMKSLHFGVLPNSILEHIGHVHITTQNLRLVIEFNYAFGDNPTSIARDNK